MKDLTGSLKIDLTVAQYEYLITKVNELTYSIDVAKEELKNSPEFIKHILKLEKQLMQLEARLENSVQRH